MSTTTADHATAPAHQVTRVIVIDDHALLAESVVMTLRVSGLEAKSLRFDTPNLVQRALDLEPSLILLDLFLGESADTSLAALEEFAVERVKVLVVTAAADRLLHARCLELGAVGIIEKSSPIETLINGVHSALRGDSVMPVSLVAQLSAELANSRRAVAPVRSPLDALTPRERETLYGLTCGQPAGAIARDHQTSVVTVRTHIRSILQKLEVHSQLEAVTMAMRQGWFG